MRARHPRAGIATTAVEGFTLGDDLTDEEVRAYISRPWGQDWDCPEDAAYDLEDE